MSSKSAPLSVHVVAVAEEDTNPHVVTLPHVEHHTVGAHAPVVEGPRVQSRHLVAIVDYHRLDAGVEARQNGRLEVIHAW